MRLQETFQAGLGIMKASQPKGTASQDNALSYQKFVGSSGMLKLEAPASSGSYDLRLYNLTGGEEMTSLNFVVIVPVVAASPGLVYNCEEIKVSYSGAPGFDNDWIGMYRSGASNSDYTARQYLEGKENGTVTFGASDPGAYNFRMFENNTYTRLATSNDVTVKIYNGTRVLASSTHVPPGGTITVTYWGAPASGTGVIGMYGVTRPDKFPIETRALGSSSCGRMTWQLPTTPPAVPLQDVLSGHHGSRARSLSDFGPNRCSNCGYSPDQGR